MRIPVKTSVAASTIPLRANTKFTTYISCPASLIMAICSGKVSRLCPMKPPSNMIMILGIGVAKTTRYVERLSDPIFVEQFQQARDTHFSCVHSLRLVYER